MQARRSILAFKLASAAIRKVTVYLCRFSDSIPSRMIFLIRQIISMRSISIIPNSSGISLTSLRASFLLIPDGGWYCSFFAVFIVF